MKFIKTEDLRNGMRLARPIYSKSGVLLFERNSKLTQQAIDSVKNFGLLGIYILEPAEPLPPMAEEDARFEAFQISTVAQIQEELNRILSTRKQAKLANISTVLLKEYRRVEDKINFYQNLRSKDDFISCHSFNVAVLCALMTRRLNVKLEEQQNTIYAAFVHDLGKLMGQGRTDLIYNNKFNPDEKAEINIRQQMGFDLVEEALGTSGVPVKRICAQALRAQMDFDENRKGLSNPKMVTGAKILMIANRYDELTAMSLSGESESEIKAIQEFLDHPQFYDETVVQALIDSVNIIVPGLSVVLSTDEQALVLTENERDILRPMVLCFNDNSILDLGLRANKDITIMDIVKTLDNRYVMDTQTLKAFGGGEKS